MPKLIDLEKIKPMDFPSTEMDGLDVVRYLNTIPTVDTVELVHGRWEPHKKLSGYLECSNCHDCMVYDSWVDGKKWGYCPNCGAKMNGGSDG